MGLSFSSSHSRLHSSVYTLARSETCPAEDFYTASHKAPCGSIFSDLSPPVSVGQAQGRIYRFGPSSAFDVWAGRYSAIEEHQFVLRSDIRPGTSSCI